MHTSFHEETAGSNDSLCDCWSFWWSSPRDLERWKNHVIQWIAQIVNNAALPVKVRTGISWSFTVPWISNAVP